MNVDCDISIAAVKLIFLDTAKVKPRRMVQCCSRLIVRMGLV
jgi:hypothetical protein